MVRFWNYRGKERGLGEYPFVPRCERAHAQVREATSDRPTPALMKQIRDVYPGPTPLKAGMAHRHAWEWMSPNKHSRKPGFRHDRFSETRVSPPGCVRED